MSVVVHFSHITYEYCYNINKISTLINLQTIQMLYHGNAATAIHAMLIRYEVMFKLYIDIHINRHYTNI